MPYCSTSVWMWCVVGRGLYRFNNRIGKTSGLHKLNASKSEGGGGGFLLLQNGLANCIR